MADGERRTLERQDLGPTSRTATRLRGPDPLSGAVPFALAGRTRLEGSLGGGVSALEGAFISYTLGLVHWVRESVAIEGVVTNADFDSSRESAGPAFTTVDSSFGLSFGARYYLPPVGLGRRFLPFLRAGLGPIAQRKTEHGTDGSEVKYTDGTVSTWLGGGLDCQLGRTFALVVRAGWDLRAEQDPRFSYGLALGFSFGRARPR